MIHHFFLPHKHKRKHRKAHLLSHNALVIYVVLFVFLQTSFFVLRQAAPGVLGTTSAISRQDIISLTNLERKKYGEPTLNENSELDQAAEEKARDMFAKNYWAHFAPDGSTSPWGFIKASGYNYQFAGENLAKGFSDSKDVMAAWMASKAGHKENVLGANYQEIGIAVEDGVLNGEKTTLVVQMFGTPTGGIAMKQDVGETAVKTVNDNKIATNIPSEQATVNIQGVESARTQTPPSPSFISKFITINSYKTTKNFALTLIIFLTSLGLIDLLVMWRRKSLTNIHIRHLPHISIIAAAIVLILVLHAGSIV